MPESATLSPPPAKASVPSQAPPAPAAAPAPSLTPMQRAQATLEEGFTDAPKAAPKTPKQTPEPKPKDEPKQPPPKDAKAPTEPTEPAADAQPKEGVQDPAKEPGNGKENPWKLVETYKGKAAKLEKELADFKNGNTQLPQLQEQLKGYKERAESAEKRAKELADHMRFVDYSKSDEFVSKFERPYQDACKVAAAELAELSIEDSTGNTRQATFNDLLALCNMKLGQARQQAEAWFGSSADDVMAHRREINRLYQDQQKALEDSKTNGESRVKQQTESWNKLREDTATLWQKFNTEDTEKYDFLKPKEGDEEHNAKLEKARGIVDSAFSGNALDPKLSPEDRAKVIRAQVAVRNRAIGYSMLKHENAKLKAAIEERDKALKEYQESEPTPGRGKNNSGVEVTPKDPLEAASRRMEAHYVT